jgi:hypothetical protein
MKSTWDILWTRGTICWPSEPEIIINSFSLSIFSRKSMHYSPSEKVLIVFTARRSWVIEFQQSVLLSSMFWSNQIRRTFWTIFTSIRSPTNAHLGTIQLFYHSFRWLLNYSSWFNMIERCRDVMILLIYSLHLQYIVFINPYSKEK